MPQTETATAAQGVIVDPALTEGTTGGVIGAAGGKGGAETGMQGGKVSGRGAGTDGGRGVLGVRDRDLEAQQEGQESGAIHYRREG